MAVQYSQLARRTLVAGAVLALAALPAAVHAQVAGPQRRSVFSINPLGIPFEYFSAEFERSVTNLASLGVTGSWLDIGDGEYTTAEVKLRFYPNEEWPNGFSLGLAGGVTRVSETQFQAPDRTETRPTIAVIVDYNWLIGKSERILVGVGVGAKRILGASGDDYNDVLIAYPTARFQVGLTF